MSEPQDKVKLFESQQVRAEWDADNEKWWFSVLDIIAVLTDQSDYKKVRNYWKWLKNKLIADGSQLVSVTNQLKMKAADGKKYLTDVADTEQILRLIQTHRFDEPRMERHGHTGIQTAQRAKERKPTRQHDQYRTGAQHAGRSGRHGYFAGAQPRRFC